MDIVNKAIARASDLANEAAWNAQQRVKISTEEKRLEDLRSKAMAKRAEIGEAMFKLWQSHRLPPSQLDGLFYELQDLVDAVASTAGHVQAVKAETYEQATSVQAQTIQSYASTAPPDPSMSTGAAPSYPSVSAGAAPPPALPPGHQPPDSVDGAPAVPLAECAACHSMVRADRNFCGHCGQRLRSSQ